MNPSTLKPTIICIDQSFFVGSIANIIVVEQARYYNVEISWKEHAKVGMPVTLVTLILAAIWLWLRS